MTNERERMWKDTVVAYFMEQPRKTRNALTEDSRRP